MDIWEILKKELNYYGIKLLEHGKCQIHNDDQSPKIQGIIKTARQLTKSINQKKKVFLFLWEELVELLDKEDVLERKIVDERMVKLFIFSLKDFSKFLLCFEELEGSKFEKAISDSLNKDIKSFSKEQIYDVSDYKISIDWVHRLISRLMYIRKLLIFASCGRRRIAKYDIKMAKGVSGPWAHLDLPMQERVFPFGGELNARDIQKKRQRRYRKGLENYNKPGVGEGHYWRELRNEPFSWADRGTEDPYPSRHMLSGKG